MLALSSLTIGNTISSYADSGNIDNNGTGGGGNVSPSTRGYIGRYWAFQENNGIRVYIANKKGEAVSNFVDFVNYLPKDIGSYNAELSKWYKDYENYTGKNPREKQIDYLCGGKKDKEHGLSKKGIFFFPKIDDNHTSKNGIPQKMYTYTMLEAFLDKRIQELFPGNTAHISPVTDPNNATYTYIDEKTQQKVEVPRNIQGPVQRGTVNGVSGTVGTGDILMKQMMTPLGEKDGDTVYQVQALLYLSLPDVEADGTLKPDGKMVPLFDFSNTALKKQQTDLMATGLNYYESLYRVAKDNGLYAVAEPVGWFVNEISMPSNSDPTLSGTDLNAFWCTPTVIYGTVTEATWWTGKQLRDYLAGKGYTQSQIRNTLNACGQTWQWSLAYTAYRLQKTDSVLGMKTFEEFGISKPDSIPDGGYPNINFMTWWDNFNTLGYGIMLFGLKPEVYVNTPTWDSIRFPEDHYKPGVTPSMEHIKTEGSDYQQAVYPDGKKKDHNFSITKFYCRENPDGTYTYKCNYTRTNTLHTITLNDEPGYKVGSYFTSPELKLPDTADTSYDDYKATLPKGDFTGNSAGNITVPASSNDRALYMKLISTKPVDEPDTVPIPLWEYEISKQIPERAITDKSHRIVTNTLPAIPNDVYESDYRAQYKPGDKYGWIKWYNYTNPGIENAPADLLAVPAPFEKSYTGLNSGKKVASRGHTKEVTNTMDSIFCIWRGMDMPTIASYKAEDTANNKSELKTLGLPEGKTPQSTRGETNQPTDISGIIENKLTSQFILNEADSNTAVSSDERTRYREEYEDDEGNTHHRWGSWSAWNHYSTEQGTKNNPTLQDYNIRVYYYLGKANSGIEQAKSLHEINERILTRNLDGTDENRMFTGRGTAIPSKEAIKLYPYSKMVYNTSHDTAFKPVYTLSQYESTIHNTDYVDMVYSKQYKESLALNSDQWSTHARSINGIGPNVVLPGGALNTLSTPIRNNTCVAVKVYQTVTPDSMEPALTSGYDYYNPAAAKARRDNLINQVQSNLDGLNVVQYVKSGIIDDFFDIFANGIKLDSNGGQQVYNNVTSTDDKYYYKKGLTAANGAKINILKSDDINENVYSISSFTDGTVEIKRDGGLIMKLEKKEGIEKINSAQELRELDIRTKFFTNFLTAIDRNSGSKGWYNEAIDSMELHVYTQIFTLGFAKPFDVRTSVLDPKLVGYQESKSDLYNFKDPDKVRSSIYMTDYDGLRDPDGWAILATWGDENSQITMQNVPYLFQSKIFYIPNATVMDTY